MGRFSNQYAVTILDRLTRLEPAYIRYRRVFLDIISKFSSLSTKNLDDDKIINQAFEILNSFFPIENDDYIKQTLINLEKKYFKIDEISLKYLSSDINYSKILDLIDHDKSLPKNVLWLKKINSSRNDIVSLRQKLSLLYPIEKIILVEGQTEYTLLKTIFKLFDFDLDKKGILVFAADGKNRAARKYYSLIEYIQIPIFILLDKDAFQIKNLIMPKLRPIDDIYLLNDGEFEDIIPKKILSDAINNFHKNGYHCTLDDFNNENSTVENLELIHKKYGFGDFKKARFAQILKDFIENNTTKDDFKESEIKNILMRL